MEYLKPFIAGVLFIGIGFFGIGSIGPLSSTSDAYHTECATTPLEEHACIFDETNDEYYCEPDSSAGTCGDHGDCEDECEDQEG